MDSILQNSTSSKAKFLNWVKAALALRVTKEELEPVAYDEIVKFQQKSLQDISTSNNLSAGSTCSNCYTENLVFCRTDKICSGKPGRCRYHNSPATQYRPSDCPRKICNNLKSMIQSAHRYNAPSYKNTNATQWCSSAWEIAKCFMPPDGYKNVTTAAETDFNGIISVFINYKEFKTKIADDLSKSGNIFEKGREVGRAVRHCSNLEIEDADLAQYFTILNKILNDPGFIAMNKSPHNGGQKLAQLRDENLIIGKDVCKMLHDEMLAIQNQLRNEMDEYKYQSEKQKLELIDTVNRKMKAVEHLGQVSIAQLHEALQASIDTLKATSEESKKEIKDVTEQGAQNGIQKIAKEKEKALKEIKQAMECRSPDLCAELWMLPEEIYEQRKQEFKENLSKYYNIKRSTVPLSPLVEEIETPLVGFYVMPNMVSVKQKSLSSNQEERTPVKSLRDLFITECGDLHEIYLSANAGFGKTAFSKYLAITWAQKCFPDNNFKHFTEEEIKAVGEFEFLFLVLLRDSTDFCSIDEMIEQQIIKKLSPPASYYPWQEVLRKERCLIILDGLDEWTHPDNGCPEQNEKIPHRYVRDNCVVLTTSRPWKLGVSNLKTYEINKKVELVQLNQDAISRLEKNAIRKMTGVHDNDALEEYTRDFSKIVADHSLKQMQNTPLLLMYILCLWCNKFPIGYSKMEVYVNIIEFLLSRTVKKHPEVDLPSDTLHKDIPKYLLNRNVFKKFSSFLMSLAELAYHTLFNRKRENTLVFKGSIAEKYLKQGNMKLSLLSGILTESTSLTLAKRTSKVSFSHKTVQEFFAAMFVSSQSDAAKILLEKCETVQSILDMSMLYEFISKMNPKMACALSDGFMSVINKDEVTHIYRNRTWSELISRNPLYNIQEMFLACVKDMPEDEVYHFHLQDFFIDENTINDIHLKRLTKSNKTNMKSLFINTEDTCSSFDELVESFSLTNLENLQKLYYDDDKGNANINIYPSLKTLTFSSAALTVYEGNLSENLERLHCLTYLNIRGLMLPHEMLEVFFNCISNRKTMKELTLWELSCKEHGYNCKTFINFDTSTNSQIEKLVLRHLPPLLLNFTTPTLVYILLHKVILGESSSLLSSDMINITHIEFETITISAERFYELLKVLEYLPQSVSVAVKDCTFKPEEEYGRVKDHICSSKNFAMTRDSSWRFEFKTQKASKE